MAGYAIKKVMKIAAVIVGLFVTGLAYLSYKGWVDVKWTAMENATRSTLAAAKSGLTPFIFLNIIGISTHTGQ
jgi:uncharacterized membrane protein (Fun14 family)